MRSLKVILAALFVLTIAFFVSRGCISKKEIRPETKAPVVSLPTKKIRIERKTPTPVQPPRMAIILDDWGNNASLVSMALAVQRPLTLSILPHLPHSRDIAEQAHQNGLGVMLHMPMQPKNKKEGLEPKTIMVTSSDREITQYLDEALADIPHAQGVNNHMGSAATSDQRVMKVFLSHLKNTSLFFVDSNTEPETVGYKTAQDLGIPFTKRDIFLDNQTNTDAIRKQLLRAKKMAVARGKVVVIGHDKKITLQVIKEMVPEIEKDGVRLVLVRELLQ